MLAIGDGVTKALTRSVLIFCTEGTRATFPVRRSCRGGCLLFTNLALAPICTLHIMAEGTIAHIWGCEGTGCAELAANTQIVISLSLLVVALVTVGDTLTTL